jgi:hypothetical protein
MTPGKTSVVWEGAKPVVTFAIPGVPGATGTATLDAKFMAEKVVVKDGTNTTEFTYSDYKDWNNPLHPAEAFYAGRMIERFNGAVVRGHHDHADGNRADVCRDACTRERQAAIPSPTLQPPNWVYAFRQQAQGPPAPAAAAEVPTPRLANGKPDLTGNWGGGGSGPPGGGNRRCGPNPDPLHEPNDNFVVDYAWISPSR